MKKKKTQGSCLQQTKQKLNVKIFFLIFLFIFVFFLGLITAAPPFSSSSAKINKKELRQKIVVTAKDFTQRQIQTFEIKGQTIAIHADCSNFVRAVYWQASDKKIDLFSKARESKAVSGAANGVTLIAKYFAKEHRLGKEEVHLGDVVVFDNTYDKNKNNKRDDLLTHAGVVIDIQDNGTVEFAHGNFGGGIIKKGYVNFKNNSYFVDGKEANSYLRRRKENEKSLPSHKFRAAELLHGFGGY